jgi:hypothetical protein
MRATRLRNALLIASLILGCACAGCGGLGGGMQGTYSDQAGAFVLDLKAGGQATFTFAGDVLPCSYTVKGSSLTLTCKGDGPPSLALTIHDDGSLTGPPGAFMPALRKTK